LNDVKSIDFTFNLVANEKYNFYCSHKYIKALNGGAQDNQYNDIRNFLRNCDKKSEGNNYFIAICDDPYFTSKIETLNNDFGSNNVITLTIDELEDYLLNIIKEKTLS
jgi:predicted 3-demethylubiquinone-9 3-methyltransferase (glyoxalase superfamily)